MPEVDDDLVFKALAAPTRRLMLDALFTPDGRSLGDILVSEGLARTGAGRREPWCGR